jgi:hypothetical protein
MKVILKTHQRESLRPRLLLLELLKVSNQVLQRLCRVLDNTETVMGNPRQIIDVGLIGMCIAFLITFLNMQPKAIDAHLNNAVVAFGIALPLLGWGYLQAALKPKPVHGWLVLQAILIGSAVGEGVGELAACIGVLFVLWHLSSSASTAFIWASIFAVIIVAILSFVGLFIYALVNAKELAKKQQTTDHAAPSAAPVQAKDGDGKDSLLG